MRHRPKKFLRRSTVERIALAGLFALTAACAGDSPVSPVNDSDKVSELSDRRTRGKIVRLASILRRVTAPYHDLDVAEDSGFVFLHACEIRAEGAVGMIYVHPARVGDGLVRPELPDALIYEPASNPSEKPKLVGVEFAIPMAMWTDPEPPRLFDAEFEAEDEFGVFGLHAWVWRENPNGIFAEANPRVSCT